MSKSSTNSIIDKLVEIGTSLGFSAAKEVNFNFFDGYNPRYDVVWYWEVDLHIPEKTLVKYIPEEWQKHLAKIPIAAFEIEGSTTTSKNQVGNIANLAMSPAFFNFLITNNDGAGTEKDIYRRAIKITRSYESFFGNKSLIVLDKFHLEKFPQYTAGKQDKLAKPINPPQRNGSGGENKSKSIADKVIKDFQESYLIQKNDYSPQEYDWKFETIAKLQNLNTPIEYDYILGKKCKWVPNGSKEGSIKKAKDYYYIPKLDLVYGLNLPKNFVCWLRDISNALNPEHVHFPILHYLSNSNNNEMFLPLIGIEIETSENKHANAGAINLLKHCVFGIIISNPNFASHFKTLQQAFGLLNITFKNTEEL